MFYAYLSYVLLFVEQIKSSRAENVCRTYICPLASQNIHDDDEVAFVVLLRAKNSEFHHPVGIFEEKLAYSIFGKLNVCMIWICRMPVKLGL